MFFSANKLKVVKQATIEFTESKKIIHWSESDGCLLYFAEAQGITALSGCRSGHCGACVVELLMGEVVYDREVSVVLKRGEVIMCSAKPATSQIKIKI